MKKSKRGGARKGAGAKRKPEGEKAVRIGEIWAPKKLVDFKGKEEIKAILKQTIKKMENESQ